MAGDPLKDIRALETVGFVMKGGQVVKSPLTAPPLRTPAEEGISPR